MSGTKADSTVGQTRLVEYSGKVRRPWVFSKALPALIHSYILHNHVQILVTVIYWNADPFLRLRLALLVNEWLLLATSRLNLSVWGSVLDSVFLPIYSLRHLCFPTVCNSNLSRLNVKRSDPALINWYTFQGLQSMQLNCWIDMDVLDLHLLMLVKTFWWIIWEWPHQHVNYKTLLTIPHSAVSRNTANLPLKCAPSFPASA